MHSEGTFAADLILASPKAYAAGAVARHENIRTGLAESHSAYGFTDLLADTEVRLQYLCEALAAGKVELFRDHLSWLKATFAAKGAPESFLDESLQCLAEELRESLPPDAGTMAAEYLADGIAHLKLAPRELPSLLEGDAPHMALTRRYLLAVLENRAQDAVQLVLDAFAAGVTIDELHGAVLVRAQEEIGRMWQTGEITVAEEHHSSRIAERVLIELGARTPKAERTGKTVVCTSVGGNMHDLGIRIASAHFEIEGWSSVLLGANMPIADLIRSLIDFEADLLALSAALALHVRSTANLIQGIRSVKDCAGIPVLVGGLPFRAVPDLWQTVGADGKADDARQAAEIGARLVAKR